MHNTNFYGLPKIHKNLDISQQCTNLSSPYVKLASVNDLKFRPIIAGPACPTHRLSNFVDILLKPFTKHVKSYIQDRADFLNSLPKSVNANTKLVSFDVVNLYSNIPHDLGIKALRYWLDKHPSGIPERVSKEFIIESIQFILDNNTFHFDGAHYKQIKGTAMGTKMAPTYATLVLGYLEEILYSKVEKHFGREFNQEFQTKWKRFLDDCFILWNRSDADLECLTKELQNLHPSLAFTKEENNEQLPFLDVSVTIANNVVETDVHYKPTDSKQYLDFNSCHPRHTKNSVPYSLARRICMIVSNSDCVEYRLHELKDLLLQRNYPMQIIDDAINKAKRQNRNDLLKIKEKVYENVLPFISTFNPRNPEIFSKLKETLQPLNRCDNLKNKMSQITLIKSKRQSRSI